MGTFHLTCILKVISIRQAFQHLNRLGLKLVLFSIIVCVVQEVWTEFRSSVNQQQLCFMSCIVLSSIAI